MGTASEQLPGRSFKGMSVMALPIILANASIPLLGVADTAVVARLGQTEALAAVAAGATILFFLLWAFGFLRMTTSALTGQAVGAKRIKEPALILVRAMVLAIFLGLLLAALGGLATDAGLRLLGVEEDVADLTRRYLMIAFWAAPGQLIIFVVHGWLLGHGKSGLMFVLSLGIGCLNLG
jgi:Na+-driven multidrug efflux pump